MTKQYDNKCLSAKISLREYYLDKYHTNGNSNVLDACQGSGKIWRNLRRKYSITKYFGLDIKPKKGRIRIKSERYLQSPGWKHNIIDIDTYGSPWRHWFALLKTMPESEITIFLTVGSVGGLSNLSKEESKALGIYGLKVPVSLAGKYHDLAINRCLMFAHKYGKTIYDVMEAPGNGATRYFGLRIAPIKSVT